MALTLRQRAGLRHSSRNGRIALGRPAVCLSAIRPYADLNAPAKSGLSGFMARIETAISATQWFGQSVVRSIREKLKL